MQKIYRKFGLMAHVLIFVLVFCVATKGFVSKTELPTDPKEMYNEINSIYYNNELPKDTIVTAGEDPKPREGVLIFGDTYHTIGTHRYRITISAKNNRVSAEELFTVYHETCHVKVWENKEKVNEVYDGGHNTDWQNCMLDLAQRGAFATLW